MARPTALPVEEKVRIVLAVLAGELTVAQAARQSKVSERGRTHQRHRKRGHASRYLVGGLTRRGVHRLPRGRR